MKKLVILFTNAILICVCATLCSCTTPSNQQVAPATPNPPTKSTLGVWWWQAHLDSSYLDFAAEHNVTEIYYCTHSFDEDTAHFVSMANALDIQVYLLAGDYRWIADPKPLYQLIDSYNQYQQSHSEKFAGIHLDIEPHQSPDFHDQRERLLTNYTQLAYTLHARYPEIAFEYDIPFWLDDIVSIAGVSKPVYQHIIDNAHRVTVMSYRDSASAIYDIAKEEITYAKSIGKVVNLGVETNDAEEDFINFAKEGAKYMYEQLAKVHDLAPDMGIAIHDIRHWKNLK